MEDVFFLDFHQIPKDVQFFLKDSSDSSSEVGDVLVEIIHISK